MSLSRFAAHYNAVDFAYGCGGITPGGVPAGLQVDLAPSVTGAGSLTLQYGSTSLTDGSLLVPLNVNAPITVGTGANAETVTPSAVSVPTPGILDSTIVTATLSNLHGRGDIVSSGTFGLQEAINTAAANGGGVVYITPRWYTIGGTAAIAMAVSLPTNGSVYIQDILSGETFGTTINSATVVSAPVAATSATVASQPGIVGTWTATVNHVLFTYVTANGGETVASADYSFTSTVSVAIGGSGPAAAAGAVGYRVYIGTNATTTCYQVPVIAANGTVIQCGPIAAFKIGTPFSVALITTSAGALIPVQNTAFPTGVQAIAAPNVSASGPFTATGSVTSTVTEMARAAFPAAFLNQVGRTLRVRWIGSWTPAGTAKLILTASLTSKYPSTATTMFTVTSAASSGAAIANIDVEVLLTIATTGATGTVEAHGRVIYSGATATPEVAIALVDAIQAVSSSIDLTKQNDLVLGISSDATITTSAIRMQIVEVLQ